MRTTLLLATVLAASSALADPPPPQQQIVGQLTDPRTHAPVEGVVVTVAGPGVHDEYVTDENGLYRAVLPAAGDYTVTFTYGDTRTVRPAKVAPGALVTLDGAVAPANETIVIHDRMRPAVIPKPKKDPDILPAYSDRAVLSDAWAKAWLLLDIDERGSVRRVKFLRRPGYDLDKIALESALATKFEPARDATGAAVATLMVWPIEWPSYWWIVAFDGVVTRRPPEYPDPTRISNTYLARVPCAGSGPLQLGSVHPAYRDCTPQPTIESAEREPWVDVAAMRARVK